MAYSLGLDFGTSGARGVVLDEGARGVAWGQVRYGAGAERDWAGSWRRALDQVLAQIPIAVRQRVEAIAVDGTSATVLLCDGSGEPVTEPLLYNDDRAQPWVTELEAISPAGSPVLSATSSLVKLLGWRATLPAAQFDRARFLLHQADWLAFHLHGRLGCSDYHNALKLGYDVGALTYPDWLLSLGVTTLLPQVFAPGAPIAPITAAAAQRYQLSPQAWVYGGTTDSIAAFLASGARSPGEAVTSLGSTLVLKLLSQTRVDDSAFGIYSHRLGDLWLVGGASNSGGAVLKQFFTAAELAALSLKIRSERPSPLRYYPLCRPGERFPINDPHYAPQMAPRPEDPIAFLQGLLEGMARIEAEGYRLLEALGASPLQRVMTAGGGAQNPAWLKIRQRHLPAPVSIAPETEAAFGAAQLARAGADAKRSGE